MQRVRFAALDAARSSMMLLGVVVHVAMLAPAIMPTTDADNFVFASIYAIVHQFRIPVFFIISGLFSAQIFHSEHLRGYLVSRFKRVVSVLMVAAPALALVLVPRGCTWCSPNQPHDYLHTAWIYLWFLYYLAIISHLMLLVRWIAHQLIPTSSGIWAWLRKPYGVFGVTVIGLLLCLIPGVVDRSGQVIISMGWIPDPSLLLFYFVFFAIGWSMVHSADKQFALIAQKTWILVSLAVLLSALSFWLWGKSDWQPRVQVLAVTLSAFAVLALFLRYLHAEKGFWRYLSGASYWVYLWHAPVLLIAMTIFASLHWGVYLVGAAGVAVTLFITLGSYELFVRNTIIGKYLSGRRRPGRWSLLFKQQSAS